jgi:predicted dehydrogenase
MIHDLDVVLALARSPVEQVDALGISVLGGHEDMATARLTFASGCVAQLTASRVSFAPRREMNVFTSRAFAAIDFATGTAQSVKPREDVLRREFDAGRLAPTDVAYWKEHVFDDLLVKSTVESPSVNALEEEQLNFVGCIQRGERLRVDGQAGRDAVAVAEKILERIDEHTWDGHPAGRRGPFAMPALPILSGPAQWHDQPEERRRAG